MIITPASEPKLNMTLGMKNIVLESRLVVVSNGEFYLCKIETTHGACVP